MKGVKKMVNFNDELDTKIKKCYDDTVIPNKIFNRAFDNAFERITAENKKVTRNKIFQMVASFNIIIILISFITINNIHSGKNSIEKNENNNINTSNNILNSSVSNEIKKIININTTEEIHSYMYFGEVEYILAIKLEGIIESTCYIRDSEKYSYPITKIKGKVLKDFKGNYKENDVEFYIFGGKIPMSEYVHIMTDKQLKEYNIKDINDSELENIYANITIHWSQNQAEAVIGETYIVSLNYDSTRYNSLRIIPLMERYNFKFYNIEKNTYKDYDNNWKEVDLNNHIFYGIYDEEKKVWLDKDVEN